MLRLGILMVWGLEDIGWEFVANYFDDLFEFVWVSTDFVAFADSKHYIELFREIFITAVHDILMEFQTGHRFAETFFDISHCQ